MDVVILNGHCVQFKTIPLADTGEEFPEPCLYGMGKNAATVFGNPD